MNIEEWLNSFTRFWKTKDVNGVVKLFSKFVEYWETPYKKIDSITLLEGEWQAIKKQQDIELETTVVASSENKHTVLWKLSYDSEGAKHRWAGVYLIELNAQGLCTYFYQVGEAKSLRQQIIR